MKRAVAVTAANIDAVKAAHASVIHERKDLRGIAALGAAGLGAAAAGFGGSLLMGVSRD